MVRRDGGNWWAWSRLIIWGLLLGLVAIWPADRRDRAHARLPDGDRARRRPNFLILVGDDHAAGMLGIDGDPRHATPRLDQLAREGVRFDRAYCNSPLCTPSRASFITGRMPHAVGVTRLATPLPADVTTLGDWLGDLGYDTGALGKMHFHPDKGGEDHHGFATRLDTSDWTRWLARRPPAGDHRVKWKPFKSPAGEWLNAEGRSFGLPAEAMESSYYVRGASAFFQAHKSTGHHPPFALVVSFYEPHAPFKFPDGWTPHFRADQFAEKPVSPADQTDQPRVFARLTDEQKRGIAASQYTSLGWLDHQVGRVLDALDASGLANETVVVYLGDNGYLLGEHGRFEKHCFYEEAVRVPLILRWPGHLPASRRVNGLVELVDLVPTLLDLGGEPLPPDLHGKSRLDLALGVPGARGADLVVSEYLENAEAMARTDRYKLIVTAGTRRRSDGYASFTNPAHPAERLYDLQADPGETTDLSARPELAPVVADLRRKLLDRLRTTREHRPLPPGLTDDQALRWCLTPQD